MSIGKPTHPPKNPGGVYWNKRGGQYRPRTGNSFGPTREKKKGGVATAANAKKPIYVPGVVVPSWAKKYAL